MKPTHIAVSQAGQYTPLEKLLFSLREFIEEAERHGRAVYSKWDGNTWKFDREHWQRSPEFQRVERAKEALFAWRQEGSQ